MNPLGQRGLREESDVLSMISVMASWHRLAYPMLPKVIAAAIALALPYNKLLIFLKQRVDCLGQYIPADHVVVQVLHQALPTEQRIVEQHDNLNLLRLVYRFLIFHMTASIFHNYLDTMVLRSQTETIQS